MSILKTRFDDSVGQTWGTLADHQSDSAMAHQFAKVLAKISLKGCRCIDNGYPCQGCTRAGREAPRLAYEALREAGIDGAALYQLTQE